MQLAAYLKDCGLTLAQFGAEIGRTAATVSRIARGLHRPDWKTMQAIERKTGGAVLPNDFRGEAPPPRKRRTAA